MGRGIDIPWVGGQYTMGWWGRYTSGRMVPYTMGREVKIPWVGGQNTMGRGKYSMGRVRGSKYLRQGLIFHG